MASAEQLSVIKASQGKKVKQSKTEMTKKVALVILNWNQGEMTLDCLRSIEKIKTDGINLEVVIVDNGSTDGSVDLIKKFFDSKSNKLMLTLLENKENLGYAEGNNTGIRHALKNGADYVCLLNNDTRVDPGFLRELIKVAREDDQIGLVGGKIYFEKGYEFHKDRYKKDELGKVIWYAGGKIDWNNVYASHRGVDEVDRGQFDKTEETEYVNGCLMLIKREVAEKIGLIDSRYYLYFEEIDFCQKARKAGYRLSYTPKAKIWHLNAGSSGVGSGLQDYFITRNRLLFGLRWAPLRSKIALLKESIKLFFAGRSWQRVGVRDFYLGKFGKGSWR